MDNNLYPTTIITTRYQGVYEGGAWAALDCAFDDVPDAATGSDIECAEFWALAKAGDYEIRDLRAMIEASGADPHRARRLLTVGVGDSPEAALAALLSRR